MLEEAGGRGGPVELEQLWRERRLCTIASPGRAPCEPDPATVSDDPERVAEAVRRYAERYRPPRPSLERVVIEIEIERLLGNVRPR